MPINWCCKYIELMWNNKPPQGSLAAAFVVSYWSLCRRILIPSSGRCNGMTRSRSPQRRKSTDRCRCRNNRCSLLWLCCASIGAWPHGCRRRRRWYRSFADEFIVSVALEAVFSSLANLNNDYFFGANALCWLILISMISAKLNLSGSRPLIYIIMCVSPEPSLSCPPNQASHGRFLLEKVQEIPSCGHENSLENRPQCSFFSQKPH